MRIALALNLNLAMLDITCLGVAAILAGLDATSHWACARALEQLNARDTPERVVNTRGTR